MKRTTKDTQTILDVLAYARRERMALPVAVEAYRADLRRSMRMQRARERTLRYARPKMAEFHERCVRRMRIQSARVRRLQRTYASWRVAS